MMKKTPYPFLPSFILRTPLLSYSTFIELFPEGKTSREQLLSILDNPAVFKAICYASPSYLAEVTEFLNNPGDCREREINRIFLTLQKYLIRMSTRCTPFGMFAGVSTGRIHDRTSLFIGKGVKMKAPSHHSQVKSSHQRLFSSGSWATYSNCYRYYEQAGHGGSFQISEIKRNKVLDVITTLPEQGKSIRELKKSLTSFVSKENEKERFIQELIDHQILVTIEKGNGNVDPIPLMIREMQSCTLDHAMIQDLRRAINFLSSFAENMPRARIQKFSRRFRARYGTGPVPLLTATDPEAGIPYGLAPVLTGNLIPEVLLNCQYENRQSVDENVPNHVGRLIREMEASKQSGSQHVSLSEDIFSKDKIPSGKLPPTFSVVIELAGEHILMHPFGGSSAANIYSRFAGSDRKIDQLISQVIATEESRCCDSIMAEVVPPLYDGIDQLLPPVAVRDYEIHLTRTYRTNGKHIIPARDLLLYEEKGKLRICSKKTGRQVIPRFTSAFNYLLHPLPLFRFLCDLQFQDFDAWFELPERLFFQRMEMIPRISLGKVVLMPATWIFRGEKLATLKQLLAKSGHEMKFRQWISRFHLPDHAVFQFGDHELLLNLRNEDCLAILAKEMKHLKEVRFRESILGLQPHQVTDGDNEFANQIIISFTKP